MTHDAAALALDDTLGTDAVPCVVSKTIADHERAKYARMWGLPEYHGIHRASAVPKKEKNSNPPVTGS